LSTPPSPRGSTAWTTEGYTGRGTRGVPSWHSRWARSHFPATAAAS
jgi:hypothetical protein